MRSLDVDFFYQRLPCRLDIFAKMVSFTQTLFCFAFGFALSVQAYEHGKQNGSSVPSRRVRRASAPLATSSNQTLFNNATTNSFACNFTPSFLSQVTIAIHGLVPQVSRQTNNLMCCLRYRRSRATAQLTRKPSNIPITSLLHGGVRSLWTDFPTVAIIRYLPDFPKRPMECSNLSCTMDKLAWNPL